MRALLLSLLIFLGLTETVGAQASCENLNPTISEHLAQRTPEGWTKALTVIREAWACYGDNVPASLYEREVFVLDRLERREEGLQRANTFFEHFSAADDSARFGRMYQRRGFLHYHLGNLADAAHDYIRTLDFATDWSPEQRASFILDIGVIFQRFDNFETTQEYYDEAARLLGNADTLDAFVRRTRSKLFYFQADLILDQADREESLDTTAYQLAAKLATKSIDLSMQEGSFARVAGAWLVLAEAVNHLGDTEAALRYLNQARRYASHVAQASFPSILTLKRGQFYFRTGAYDQAERILEEALELARTGQHIDFERRALIELGELYEIQGRYEHAADYFRAATEVTERYRQSLRMTAWSILAFNQWQYAYRGLVRVLLAQGRHREAFEALEQTRARHLLDLRTQTQLLTQLSPADSIQFNTLTDSLVSIRNRLATGTLDTDLQNQLHTEEQRLIAARRALLKIEATSEAPRLDTLQQHLAEHNQTLVSYFLDHKGLDDALYGRVLRPHAFVVTPDTLVAVPLDISTDSTQALLTKVSPLFEHPESLPGFGDRQFSLVALHKLYTHLYAPAAPYIPDTTRLVVIPDGPLFMLPFGMLVEHEVSRYQYRQASFLLEKHPISVELATTLLLQKPESRAAPRYDVVALGKSQFDDTTLPDQLRASTTNEPTLATLPAVAEEIDTIAALFSNAMTRIDEDATEAAFFTLAASSKIVHLASHTLIRPSLPLQNAIVLSEDPAMETYDGFLYLHEIQRQRLAAQLVVLSGCGTATGVLQPGEGMAGLQYAFRAMGVQSSLATSWFVDDKTTVHLMEDFYRNLQQGLPKDIALQRAQLEHLENAGPLNASPFFWAAPVLYGHTASLTLAGRLPLWLWAALSLILIALLYLGARSLRKHLATR